MIILSNEERELFKVLLGSRDNQGRCTVLRVAGGWVRDKILGRESDDVDIALDDQSGIEFASHLNAYLESLGFETHKLAVITANPDQSKHIETAVVRVMGFSIDLVNLRSETYSEDSRIPTIQFGTPAEDAERRDFTVNALFYNLNTGAVEDFTNLGLTDLAAGIIRTPVDPLITFRDDPLRVLRAIRFSARYAFSYNDALVASARHAEIHNAMLHKVSRERVWKELKPMICNESRHTQVRPLLAIASLFYFGIFSIVFCIPELDESTLSLAKEEEEGGAHPDTSTVFGASDGGSMQGGSQSSLSMSLLQRVIERREVRSFETSLWCGVLQAARRMAHNGNGTGIPAVVPVSELVAISPDPHLTHSRIVYLAAALNGLRSVLAVEKKKAVRVPILILRDALKVDNDTVRAVLAVLESVHPFQKYKCNMVTGGGAAISREETGLVLRTVKGLWREALWIACADELAAVSGYPLYLQWQAHISSSSTSSSSSSSSGGGGGDGVHRWSNILFDVSISPAALTIIEGYQALEAHILSLGLDGCWDLKPLLDGNQMMQTLGLKKGPNVGKVMDAQLRWMLHTGPHATQEECAAYLASFLSTL